MLSTSGLLCSVFLICSCRVICYATDTIESDYRIREGGITLVSTGGRFELGFFNASGGRSQNRYVGIWYKQDPQTIVWVANRNSPANSNSTGYFVLEDGNLKVSDTSGKEYWAALESSSSSRSAKLMDSGNLVLIDDDDQFGRCLWESFKDPTDTFLPGMKMEEDLSLTSWIRDDDPGKGRFSFQLRQEGENKFISLPKPVLYFVKERTDSVDERGQTRGEWTQMPPDVAFLLLNSAESTKPEPLVRPGGRQMTKSLHNSSRLVMNCTGRVEYLVQANNSQWKLIWRAPEDKCENYNYCGDFGSCNAKNPVPCKCLPGFKPTDPDSWNSGNYIRGCIRISICSQNDTFLSLKMMKASNQAREFDVNNETQCRKYCLESGLCDAYSYGKAGKSKQSFHCRIWPSSVSNLEEEYKNGGISLYVRVAKSDIGTPFPY